ncbi:hypothetical protein [Psychroflexus planctonicus]|nr:hypothetical protein [Psychroflexus planctonicus]
MNISKSTWFYIAAALITIYGLVTGSFLLVFLAFPIGLFGINERKNK